MSLAHGALFIDSMSFVRPSTSDAGIFGDAIIASGGRPPRRGRAGPEGVHVDYAHALDNVAGTTWCLQMRAWQAINLRDPHLALCCLDRYQPLAVKTGLLTRQASALFLRGVANVQLGDVVNGSALAKVGLDQWHELGGKFHCSEYAAQIAGQLVQAGAGRLAEDFLDFGEMIQSTSDERFCESELMRLRGALFHAGGDVLRGTALIHRAMEIARADGAWMFAIRCALTLHQQASDPGLREEARRGLASVLAEVEACETVPEYRAARTIIGSGVLPSTGGPSPH